MSQQKPNSYSAAFKERAVKLAVESDQPIAQTARDLGVNENTLHTWITKHHGARDQQARVNAEHVYDELKRLTKENALLKEERDILKNGLPDGAGLVWTETPVAGRLSLASGCGRRPFGDDNPVKKHGPGRAADLTVVA